MKDGLNITKSAERREQEIQKDLKNKTLRVVVKEVSHSQNGLEYIS